MKKILLVLLVTLLASVSMILAGCTQATEHTDYYQSAVDSGYLGSKEDLKNEILALIGDNDVQIDSVSYDDFILKIVLDDGTELSCTIKNPNPHIGENGNWWIGNNDLGIKAEVEKKVTVEFNAFYNVKNKTQEVVVGECLELPTPVKEGYQFIGWFTGSGANDKQFTSYDPIFKDMKLYAKWKENTEYDYTEGLSFSFLEYFNEYAVEFENSVYSNYRETITEIIIPSSYNDGENGRYPVTAINMNTFNNFTNLEKIVLPDTISYIGQWAFSGCEKLESITLPDNAMVVSFDAFNNCTSLKEIVISENNQHYISKDGIIYDKNAPRLMFMPPALGIVDFVIPDYITNLNDNSFAYNVTLKNITLNDNITAIEHATFKGCMELEAINKLDNIISIDGSAFYDCTSLESIGLSENLTTIGNDAFSGCTSLKSINLPNSLMTLGSNAFYQCESLEEITLPSNVTVLENGVFSNCTNLTKVNGIERVTTIGEGAFSSCKNLKGIVLNQNLSRIEMCTFWNCTSLTSIIIPKNVTYVGDGAFQYCHNMQEINYEGKEAEITFGNDIYSYSDAKIDFEYVAN